MVRLILHNPQLSSNIEFELNLSIEMIQNEIFQALADKKPLFISMENKNIIIPIGILEFCIASIVKIKEITNE